MPENSSPIRNVLFDAAGTLIYLREPVGETYSRIARRHQFILYPDAVEQEFRRIWKEMPPLGTPLRNGDPSEKNWWRWLVYQILNELCCAVCEDHDDYFEELFAHYAQPEAWLVYPEAPKVLEALQSRGLRLAVLSNFDSRLLPVLAGLGLSPFFDQIFYSGAIGHAKPDRRIFQHALQAMAISASECLHVGDNPVADWQGARDSGLAVFELNRPKTDLTAVLDLLEQADFSD